MSGECDQCGEHCLECRCNQEKNSLWISVKDRLPEIVDRQKENPCSDRVLVTDGINIQVGIRWTCGKEEHFLPDYREEFEEITHWMPLPEPPTENDLRSL